MCRTTNVPPALKQAADKLNKDDKWIAQVDYDAFAEDVRRLGEQLEKNQGEADVKHLNKMVGWSNTCAFLGLVTMGLGVNFFSIVMLSTWTFTRWTMIAHHTCHGGYDKCHPQKHRWNRFKFAIGSFWRRLNDWMDWMLPEAWNVEHNNRHHYNLSELDDPDLVENNLRDLRESKLPLLFKYAQVIGAMLTWKWFYYAPNTYKELKLAKLRREGKPLPQDVDPTDAVTFKALFGGGTPFYSLWEFVSVVVGPYLVIHFFLLPLPYFFIGQRFAIPDLYSNAVANLFLAELLTNMHGFVAVVTNHAGDDMYRFKYGCRPFSSSFFVRQVVASVDFDMGTDLVDFLHGFLNYQIEHHLWPNLSMLSYQKAAPLVREICDKHGVPYIKENVFWRVKKTVDIMVGKSSMREFPEEFEKKLLEMDALYEAQKKISQNDS